MAGQVSEAKERTIAELQARYCTEVNYDASKFNSDLWDSGYARALEDAALELEAGNPDGVCCAKTLADKADAVRSLAKGKEGSNGQNH